MLASYIKVVEDKKTKRGIANFILVKDNRESDSKKENCPQEEQEQQIVQKDAKRRPERRKGVSKKAKKKGNTNFKFIFFNINLVLFREQITPFKSLGQIQIS